MTWTNPAKPTTTYANQEQEDSGTMETEAGDKILTEDGDEILLEQYPMRVYARSTKPTTTWTNL